MDLPIRPPLVRAEAAALRLPPAQAVAVAEAAHAALKHLVQRGHALQLREAILRQHVPARSGCILLSEGPEQAGSNLRSHCSHIVAQGQPWCGRHYNCRRCGACTFTGSAGNRAPTSVMSRTQAVQLSEVGNTSPGLQRVSCADLLRCSVLPKGRRESCNAELPGGAEASASGR